MKKYDLYLEAKANHECGKSFLALLSTRDSQSGRSFPYSPCHSKVMLMICGQHYTGGPNYHESPEIVNEAILASINAKQLLVAAVEYLRLKEVETLKNCEAEVVELQKEIQAMKELPIPGEELN